MSTGKYYDTAEVIAYVNTYINEIETISENTSAYE